MGDGDGDDGKDGYDFSPNDIPFCDSSCFSKFLARSVRACIVVVDTNGLWTEQCWGCGTTCDCSRAGELGELDVYYTNDEHESDDCYTPMLWNSSFCSKGCLYRTLPTILRFLREEWQTHDYTVGFRNIIELELPDWLREAKEWDASVLNLLYRDGWHCKAEWGGECAMWEWNDQSNTPDGSEDIPILDLSNQERIDSIFPRAKYHGK